MANIISDHPDLANYTTEYAPEDLNEDLDVLFNIRELIFILMKHGVDI